MPPPPPVPPSIVAPAPARPSVHCLRVRVFYLHGWMDGRTSGLLILALDNTAIDKGVTHDATRRVIHKPKFDRTFKPRTDVKQIIERENSPSVRLRRAGGTLNL